MNISWHDFVKAYGPECEKEKLPQAASFTKGRNLNAVCMLARESGSNRLVEIGTAFGHTAVALAKVCPDAEVVTFDVTAELAGEAVSSRYGREIQPKDKQASFIRKQPEEVRRRIIDRILSLDRTESMLARAASFAFGFAYIDGDHTWRSVAQDTKAVLDRISDDGIIVWDDYGTANEVKAFIDIANRRTGNKIAAIEHTRIVYLHLAGDQRTQMLKALGDL